MQEVEMAGFNARLRTRKDSAHAEAQPIEKADASDKRDLFREELERVRALSQLRINDKAGAYRCR
jgi:hypothetical protein